MDHVGTEAPRPEKTAGEEDAERGFSLRWICLGWLVAFVIWLPFRIALGAHDETTLERGVRMGLFLGCCFAMNEFRFRRERLRNAAAVLCLTMAVTLALSFLWDLDIR